MLPTKWTYQSEREKIQCQNLNFDNFHLIFTSKQTYCSLSISFHVTQNNYSINRRLKEIHFPLVMMIWSCNKIVVVTLFPWSNEKSEVPWTSETWTNKFCTYLVLKLIRLLLPAFSIVYLNLHCSPVKTIFLSLSQYFRKQSTTIPIL